MGQGCFIPNKNLKYQPRNYIEDKRRDYPIHRYNYNEVLEQVLKVISTKYLNVNTKETLTSRTLPNTSIAINEDNEYQVDMLTTEDIVFFDDKYSIKDLEDFLSNCSHNMSPSSVNDSIDSQCMSLYDRVLSDNVDITKLTEDEMKYLLKDEKIHLKLAEDELQFEILNKLFKRANGLKLLTDVIDLENKVGNPAISIAILKKNSPAFVYLLEQYAGIPIYIIEEHKKTPFLIYLAMHGKIRRSTESNEVEYMLYKVLHHILYVYKKRDFLQHLTAVDEQTKVSLPHLLLNLYRTTADLKDSIIDCLSLCIRYYPDCADIMCTNYYFPNYKFDVLANMVSHPELSADVTSELVQNLSSRTNDNNKAMLRHLVQVHQSKSQRDKLLTSLN